MKSIILTFMLLIELFLSGCCSTGNVEESSVTIPLPSSLIPLVPQNATVTRDPSDTRVYDIPIMTEPDPKRINDHKHRSAKQASSIPNPDKIHNNTDNSTSEIVNTSNARMMYTPKASIRLKDPEIQSGKESILTLVIAVKKSYDQLDQILSDYQGHWTQTNKNKPAPQTVHSEIDSSLWSHYKFVKAKIWHCPEFLTCTPNDDVKSTLDTVLIWSFPILAKDTDSDQSGYLGVKIYGDNHQDGQFSEEITEIPPLNPSIKVLHNFKWWEHVLSSSKDILDLIHENLVVMGSIVALLLAWLGYSRSKKKSKT